MQDGEYLHGFVLQKQQFSFIWLRGREVGERDAPLVSVMRMKEISFAT